MLRNNHCCFERKRSLWQILEDLTDQPSMYSLKKLWCKGQLRLQIMLLCFLDVPIWGANSPKSCTIFACHILGQNVTALRASHTTFFIPLTLIYMHVNAGDQKRKLMWISQHSKVGRCATNRLAQPHSWIKRTAYAYWFQRLTILCSTSVPHSSKDAASKL